MSTIPPVLPGDVRRRTWLLGLARLGVTILAAAILALWLGSLPAYISRVSTETVRPLWIGGQLEASNDMFRQHAAARGLSMGAYALYSALWASLPVAIFSAVGLLILWRAHRRWFGLFTAVVLVGQGAVFMGDIVLVAAPPVPILTAYEAVNWFVWPALYMWLYFFPGGWPSPRWTAWAVVLLQTTFLLLNTMGFLAVHALLPAAAGSLQYTIGVVLVPVTLGIILYSQIHRYRRVYTPAERQQIKWFLFGLALLFIGIGPLGLLASPDQISPYLNDLIVLPFLVLPVSIAIALLRYGLWDIDVIIRKALTYATLTSLLAVAFLGSVVLLQRLLVIATGQESPVATVASTLVVAVLFNPLRRHIQTFIDRRLYRTKYDAQQVLARFAVAARDEAGTDRLVDQLAAAVHETVQPAYVSVWLAPKKGTDK